MRPPTACVACRNRRRKCEVEATEAACTHCQTRNIQCSLAKGPLAAWPTQQPVSPVSPTYNLFTQHRNSVVELPEQQLCEELVDLYFRYIHDSFHSLFHRPSLMEDVARGTLPKVILFAIMSLAARFSTHSSFFGVNPRDRGKAWARESQRLLDLRDISLTTVQACVLLGAISITEGEAAAEAVYYSVACRVSMLLDLATTPVRTRVEREVNTRVWWSLCMIDVWSSAGVRLPQSIPSPGLAPLPMDELTFLQLRPGDHSEINLGYNSDYSLLAQMIKLNAILVEINAINVAAAAKRPSVPYGQPDYQVIDNVSLKLDDWVRNIPDEMQDTPDNLARYAARGLGSMFVAVYLGYYNYGQMLYYQFLHEDRNDQSTLVHAYANKCKAYATGLCEILYRSYATPGSEALYTMVGHVLVIASTVQLHILLFDSDELQIRAARMRLERNFEILTRLQSYWSSLDVCFSRLRDFHKACQNSSETSFRMDQWMLRFLLEFAKPVGEKEIDEVADLGPWTMQSLGFSPLS